MNAVGEQTSSWANQQFPEQKGMNKTKGLAARYQLILTLHQGWIFVKKLRISGFLGLLK